MKVGIISDIHGNFDALTSVIKDMKKTGIDSVIVLGDIIFNVFGESEHQKCYDAIEKLHPIAWVKGNTDDWLNEIDDKFKPANEFEEKIVKEFNQGKEQLSEHEVQKIKNLKAKQEITIDNRRILCVHGSDRKMNEPIGIMTSQTDLQALLNRLEADILLCGHTHAPFIIEADGKLIMNVGSVGLPKDDSRASYGILTFDEYGFEYSIRRVKIKNSIKK